MYGQSLPPAPVIELSPIVTAPFTPLAVATVPGQAEPVIGKSYLWVVAAIAAYYLFLRKR